MLDRVLERGVVRKSAQRCQGTLLGCLLGHAAILAPRSRCGLTDGALGCRPPV
jgi:hypothetical protein